MHWVHYQKQITASASQYDSYSTKLKPNIHNTVRIQQKHSQQVPEIAACFFSLKDVSPSPQLPTEGLHITLEVVLFDSIRLCVDLPSCSRMCSITWSRDDVLIARGVFTGGHRWVHSASARRSRDIHKSSSHSGNMYICGFPQGQWLY